MRKLGMAAGAAFVVAGVLAGCIPTAPTHYVDPGASASGTAEAPSAAHADITVDVLEKAFAALPASDPLRWRGGIAVSDGANPDAYQYNVASPEECLVFYAAEELAFEGDLFGEGTDKKMQADLFDAHGPGYDDDDLYARISVRLLDDPVKAETELFDAMAAAGPQCSSYYVHYTLADWRVTDVASLVVDYDADVHPSTTRAMTALVTEDALEYSHVSWAIALVDNAVAFVAYYGGEGAPYPDGEGAAVLMSELLSAIEAVRTPAA